MPKPTPIVFVVDDDSSIRESLSLLLSSAGYGIKTFASAKEFLESERGTPGPACLVLDVKMPGLSGLDLQKELKSRNTIIPIIFITGHGDIPMSVQAMKKGAVDFLPKPFDDDDLLDAVKEALLKDSQTHAELNDKKHILQRLGFLTTREHEVLTYLITGMLNKQIAYELNISERTVKAHRKQVFEKMGVRSIAELVRLTEKVGVMSFLYIEPYEVRHEILARVKDLAAWIDLGLRGSEFIEADENEPLKKRVGEFFLKRDQTLIDGRHLRPILDRGFIVSRPKLLLLPAGACCLPGLYFII